MSEASIYRWMKQESFQTALRAARRDILAHTTTRLQQMSVRALAALSVAATKRRIRSSRKGDKERNRRWMSLWLTTTTSIKQNRFHLFHLFLDRALVKSRLIRIACFGFLFSL